MKTILLISGKLQSGKNTFADYLCTKLQEKDNNVIMDMFALDVKQNTSRLFKGLSDVLASIKKEIQQEVRDYAPLYSFPAIDKLDLLEENFFEEKTEISRCLLQTYGTDIMRNQVMDSYWVDKFVERTLKESFDYKIVTDVRFENEIENMKELEILTKGEYRIYSVRVSRDTETDGPETEHESEKALDDYAHFDYDVDNNGTPDELELRAGQLAGIL